METRVKALTTLLSALEAFSFVGANSAFLNKSQHFTVHLFRPWRPGSARGSDGGPRRSWGVGGGTLELSFQSLAET